MRSDEFIMEFKKDGEWKQYYCTFSINKGDAIVCNMESFDVNWREEDCLFDIDNLPIVIDFSYDTIWKQTSVIHTHGTSSRTDCFKIIREVI